MNMKEKISGMEVTGEEFLAAYHAATPEIRKKVRFILAENCRDKGDYERAARILSMKD